MTIDALSLRRVLSHFATGVTVLATRHRAGGACGLTANAFSSVSLNPPLALVCVDRATRSYPCLVESRAFTASFLSAGQADLAVRFAGKEDDKFDGVPVRTGVTGLPILEGAIGHVECELEAEHDGGDHAILVASILSAGRDEGLPLVFFESRYTTTAGHGPA